MSDDRALRIAVAAGEQATAKNPELAAQIRANYTRFIRRVWGGPAARLPEGTNRSEQSFIAGDVGVSGRWQSGDVK